MSPDNTNIILGPPGTGKTTYLMNQLDESLRNHPSHTICFISFTKKAAYEALERACNKFDMYEEDFPMFRTMHSLAFEYLHLKRGNVMSTKDYFEVSREAGVGINFEIFDDFGIPQGFQKGNQILNIISHAKCRKKEVEEVWEEEGEDLLLDEVISFKEILDDYKFQKTKRDFDDMIIDFSNGGTKPRIQILFIDEAQDLSAIQWDMANYLSRGTIRNYIAGDDDQSIYEWAGADVNQFINLKGHVHTLNQSWRVPQKVWEISNNIVGRIQNRREKEWNSVKKEGGVEYINSLEELDHKLRKGTWLLLGRTNSQLLMYEELCRHIGLFYKYTHRSKDFTDIVNAVRDWGILSQGGAITARRAKIIYSFLSSVERVKHGAKGMLAVLDDKEIVGMESLKKSFGLLCSTMDWDNAMDRLPDIDREYVTRAIEIDSIEEPRIVISTIHGAKGGEAENVVVMKDMGFRAFNGMDDNPDAEHRVWYVAITRTINNLFILEPETQYTYEI